MEPSGACDARVVGPHDVLDPDVRVVNCTSKSKEAWCHGLSPFFLGPVQLYGGRCAKNLENAWQYSKVYKHHVDPATGEPTAEYWAWAEEGWANPRAVRFPMGRGAKPEYSYWDGKKYGYVDARKKIYAPLYASLVAQTNAFKKLTKIYENEKRLYLWDYDGYDHASMNRTIEQVLEDPELKMGHAFVLLMLLRGERLWEITKIHELTYQSKNRESDSQKKGGRQLTSSGLIIKSANLYLVCHATNRKPVSPSDGNWTIPKGVVDSGETAIEAAIRELVEETGIDLKGEELLRPLLLPPDARSVHSYTVRNKKVLVFEINDEKGLLRLHRKKELRCSSIIEGDGSPEHMRGLPELDGFMWVSREQARSMVFRSQRCLFA